MVASVLSRGGQLTVNTGALLKVNLIWQVRGSCERKVFFTHSTESCLRCTKTKQFNQRYLNVCLFFCWHVWQNSCSNNTKPTPLFSFLPVNLSLEDRLVTCHYISQYTSGDQHLFTRCKYYVYYSLSTFGSIRQHEKTCHFLPNVFHYTFCHAEPVYY